MGERLIASIDDGFISHFDADHVNGIIEMLEEENCGISIKRLIISAAVPLMEEMRKNENYLKFLKAASNRIPVILMDAGDEIETGEVLITALAPDTAGEQYKSRDLNDNSLVLHLLSKTTGITALFTGDMSTEVEEGLLEELGRGKESLKVLKEPVTILKSVTLKEMLADKPCDVIEKAVRGMLPKGPLGNKMYKKLFVYEGAEHPHDAQKPEKLVLNSAN